MCCIAEHNVVVVKHYIEVEVCSAVNENHSSGVTIGRARRAVHAGPALWGAQNLPDAVFKNVFWGKRGPFLNTCTRAHCNLVTPLNQATGLSTVRLA